MPDLLYDLWGGEIHPVLANVRFKFFDAQSFPEGNRPPETRGVYGKDFVYVATELTPNTEYVSWVTLLLGEISGRFLHKSGDIKTLRKIAWQRARENGYVLSEADALYWMPAKGTDTTQ